MSRNYAIVLSGGRGSRMKSDIPKQYMEVLGRPLIYYSLAAFEECDFIDEIILVTLESDIEYCRRHIIEKYSFTKVKNIVAGGGERYESVYNGLQCISHEGIVFIHDVARPCINNTLLEKLYKDAISYRAVVAAVPSKDTVKISDESGIVESTPDRNRVWIVQTPQVFSISEIKEAYDSLMNSDNRSGITDDAMVMESFGTVKVHLTSAEYTNIKVTTPEDIFTVENTLKNFQKK